MFFLTMIAALLLAGFSGAVGAQAGNPAVTAKDQALGSDNSVTVENIVAAQDGWIVVHESNADGTVKVPDIIGKTAVKAGTSANVKIMLDKQVANGAKLWPMLHIDAGVIGTYEFPGADTPVTVNGQIVMVPIMVSMAQTGNPAVVAKNQALGSDNSIMVESVTAAQDGWIAVHESNADGTVKAPDNIGVAPVKAGQTMNVKVMLGKQVAAGAKLWPMLHIDAGTIGAYEFPGADTPVTVNGQIAMVSIIVGAAQTNTPAVMAKDQALGSDNSIMVESVTAAQDGWIAVHESNPDGTVKAPDNIGVAPVKAGQTMNVKVMLGKQVANGAKLWPMLHIDAGTIGTYEFPGADTPVTVNGQIAMVPIIVSTAQAYPPPAAGTPPAGEASVTAGDQTSDGSKVVVGMVVAAQDGWIVIHESNPDGSVHVPEIIGKMPVKAGMTHNIEIMLDKQVANGAKLWAMLHIDAGTLGSYEFPGPDVPVTRNGEIVMMPFLVSVGSAPGMPTTGAADGLGFSLALLTVLALSVLVAGVTLRRRTSER